MKYQPFEDYLQEQHAENYTGTDDDMPDAFEAWVSNLDVSEVMDFAEAWGSGIYNQIDNSISVEELKSTQI